jgi:ABC-type nitrate/sulfonate/bicarbonate transport system substrate-binding protein
MNKIPSCFKAMVAVSILAVAAGCSREKSPTEATPKQTLSVAYSISPAAAPFLLATEKNFWSEEGINLEAKELTVGRLCLDAVLAGNADMGTVADTPLVYAALSGAKFYVLCTFTYSTEHQRCFARRDRGIFSPADLAGKKVAAYLGTASEFHMDAFLQAHGMRRDQVEVINLRPQEMVNAIVTGQVDAAFVWEPFATEIEQRLGPNATRFPVSEFYTMTFNLVSRPEFVEKNPELAAKAVGVLLRTTQFMADNRAESITSVSKKMGIKRELLEKIWDGYRYEVRLDSVLLDSMTRQAAWVRGRDANLGASAVPLRSFLYDPVLRSIKPSAISLPDNAQ